MEPSPQVVTYLPACLPYKQLRPALLCHPLLFSVTCDVSLQSRFSDLNAIWALGLPVLSVISCLLSPTLILKVLGCQKASVGG